MVHARPSTRNELLNAGGIPLECFLLVLSSRCLAERVGPRAVQERPHSARSNAEFAMGRMRARHAARMRHEHSSFTNR